MAMNNLKTAGQILSDLADSQVDLLISEVKALRNSGAEGETPSKVIGVTSIKNTDNRVVVRVHDLCGYATARIARKVAGRLDPTDKRSKPILKLWVPGNVESEYLYG